ncbi:hypothetical protein TanjilG_20786 [Lupinus angustifolius]|uniref:Hydroxyproline-rich glycoprotein family protein n=1 Tax=Lupinus angustifolius TaxID=3871 RepID=A0A4P1QRS5_LUPAN|nr:hypothetical protein TanjilG_20786 [Lupinus angustifolius]
MASTRLFFLAFFIALSLFNIGNVQANRKLLAPTTPSGFGNIPALKFPPFPPVTEWPEYRLPPPIFNIPDFSSIPSFFSPPAATTTTKP